MARRRVPVVGANQLHPVQLSPQIRHLEAKRTKEAARRAAAPTLAADRGAFGVANKEYGREAASARGATSAVQSSLAQALAGLKGSGLSGSALRQTRNEFTSRSADAASALPSLLAGAQEERGKAITSDRQQLISDRASMQSSAASALNQRLKELRGQGSTAVAAEQAAKKSSSGESSDAAAEVQLAVQEAKRLFRAYPTELPENPEEWAQFAGAVAKADGVGLKAAIQAIRILHTTVPYAPTAAGQRGESAARRRGNVYGGG